MKKLALALASATALISAPALAADLGRMPVRAPVAYAPAPGFNWSGCYLGVHGGGGWGDKRWAGFGSHDISGGMAGGQIGCDWQTGTFVFGVEGSASWADLTGSHVEVGTGLNDRSRVDFLGTVTGRVGWAWDRTLLYVKGGAAVADDEYRTTTAAGALFNRADHSRWGWLVGAGVEWAFAPSWSAKLEYNFMDFGRENVNFTGGFTTAIDQQVHVVKAGINYRFNWGGPVMAAY